MTSGAGDVTAAGEPAGIDAATPLVGRGGAEGAVTSPLARHRRDVTVEGRERSGGADAVDSAQPASRGTRLQQDRRKARPRHYTHATPTATYAAFLAVIAK